MRKECLSGSRKCRRVLRLVLFGGLALVGPALSAGLLTPEGAATKYEKPWPKKYYQRCADDAAALKGNCDFIFIGDSITMSWSEPPSGAPGREMWDRWFAPRGAVNFGISADRIGHVLYRMDTIDLEGLDPKWVVLMIGTNNLGEDPETIAGGIGMVIEKAKELFPGAQIVLCSLLPNARANDKMMAVNEIIKGYDLDERVTYLDLVPLFPPEGDSWRGLKPDKLHLTAEGYQVWAEALLPLVGKPAAATVNDPA